MPRILARRSKSTFLDRFCRHRGGPARGPRWSVLLAALCLAVGLPTGLAAQDSEVLGELGERYDVRQISDGYVLSPRDDEGAFSTLEILRGKGFVLDLRTVDQAVVEDLLGSQDASRVRELLQNLEGRRVRSDHRHRISQRFALGRSVRVSKDESAGEAISIGGSVTVDGEVRGDAVAVGGPVRVRGRVKGSVTAVAGGVTLEPGAEVLGDVVSVGGAIHRDPTAEIQGEVTEITWQGWVPGVNMAPSFHWGPGVGFLEGFVGTAFLAIILGILALVARGPVDRVAEHAMTEPWKAGLVGLAAEILALPVFVMVVVVLAISIIGIPLLVLFLLVSPLLVAITLLLGYGGVALALGRRIVGTLSMGVVPVLAALAIGVIFVQGWSLLGDLLAIIPGPVRWFAFLVILFGGLLKYVVYTVGLGSVLLAIFTPRPAAAAAAAAAAAPPPPPPAPPPIEEEPNIDTDWEDLSELRREAGLEDREEGG